MEGNGSCRACFLWKQSRGEGRTLSGSLRSPAPPKGELLAICRLALIKLPLRGKTSPGRGKMSRSDKKGNLARRKP